MIILIVLKCLEWLDTILLFVLHQPKMCLKEAFYCQTFR